VQAAEALGTEADGTERIQFHRLENRHKISMSFRSEERNANIEHKSGQVIPKTSTRPTEACIRRGRRSREILTVVTKDIWSLRIPKVVRNAIRETLG